MDAAVSMTILKCAALWKLTLSHDQREALIAEFECSGLPGTLGINYGAFAS